MNFLDTIKSYSLISMFVLAIFFYYSIRYYLNKHEGLNIPLLPKRYYNNPKLNLVQYGMLVVSIFASRTLLTLLLESK